MSNISFSDYIDDVLSKHTSLQPVSIANVRNYILSNKVLFEVYHLAYVKENNDVSTN